MGGGLSRTCLKLVSTLVEKNCRDVFSQNRSRHAKFQPILSNLENCYEIVTWGWLAWSPPNMKMTEGHKLCMKSASMHCPKCLPYLRRPLQHYSKNKKLLQHHSLLSAADVAVFAMNHIQVAVIGRYCSEHTDRNVKTITMNE